MRLLLLRLPSGVFVPGEGREFETGLASGAPTIDFDRRGADARSILFAILRFDQMFCRDNWIRKPCSYMGDDESLSPGRSWMTDSCMNSRCCSSQANFLTASESESSTTGFHGCLPVYWVGMTLPLPILPA